MNKYMEKYIVTLQRAIPKSGFRPATEAEWNRLQRAMTRASYYFNRAIGMDKNEARSMAELVHGGAAGRLLLEAAFSDQGEAQ